MPMLSCEGGMDKRAPLLACPHDRQTSPAGDTNDAARSAARTRPQGRHRNASGKRRAVSNPPRPHLTLLRPVFRPPLQLALTPAVRLVPDAPVLLHHAEPAKQLPATAAAVPESQ
jgi:hypothetical protein